MGFSEPHPIRRHPMLPVSGPTVRAIIIATAVIFVIQYLLAAFKVVYLPAYLGVKADHVFGRLWVWQILTYVFLHSLASPWHLIFNMIALYWAGGELELMFGRRRFLVLYFGGGMIGGLAYCFTQLLSPVKVPAIGASAAVMAVLVVFAIYFPNRQVLLFFLIPVKVKWLVALFVGIDLLYSIGPDFTGVAHTAHLGGALFGFLFWRFYPVLQRYVDRLEDRRRERRAQSLADDDRRMDELLAKISREGFDSLTRRDRDFLNEMSRRRRDRGYKA